MVSYPISWDDLRASIDKYHHSWRKNAGRRQRNLLKLKAYKEKTEIWHEIKPVFMTLQYNKCAYCEQQLEGLTIGNLADLPPREINPQTKRARRLGITIQHDLEHFRPKSFVEAYPPTSTDDSRRTLTYLHPLGTACTPGYYDLAYHPLNYLVACKSCNSDLKANYFPIQGKRQIGTQDPALCKAELPLLICPIGDLDIDPEDAIEFDGITAVPKRDLKDNNLRDRAVFTIDFFKLNNRDELNFQRASGIALLHSKLKEERNAQTPEERQSAQEWRELLIHKSHPHTNCLRSFARLFYSNPTKAQDIANICSLVRRPPK